MPVKIGNIEVVGYALDDLKKDGIYCIENLDEKIKNRIPLDYEFLLVDGKNGGFLIEAIECIYKEQQPSKLLKEFITREIGNGLESQRESPETSKETNIKEIIFKWLSRVMERLPGRIIVVGNGVLTAEMWKATGGEIAGWLKRRVAWIDKFENVTINGLKTEEGEEFKIRVEEQIEASKFKLLLYSTWLKKSFNVSGYEVSIKLIESESHTLTIELIRNNLFEFKYRLLKRTGTDIKRNFFTSIPFSCPRNCLRSYQKSGWAHNLDLFLENYNFESNDDAIIRKEIKELDYFNVVKESIITKVKFQPEKDSEKKKMELVDELKKIVKKLAEKKGLKYLPQIYNIKINKEYQRELNFKEGRGGNLILEYTRHLEKLEPDQIKNNRAVTGSDIQKFYIESLSGASIHFGLLYDIISHGNINKKVDLFFKLAENGLLRILIADERISGYVKGSEEIQSIYKCAGVNVIKNLDEFIKNIGIINELLPVKKEKAKKQHEIEIVPEYDFDVLIIHQGILDKTKLDIEEIEKCINSWKRYYFPLIIVTSGRGTPANIPCNVRFMPFSILESNLINSSPSKFILTNIIFKTLSRRII